MVECESWTPPLLLDGTNVLIDTWWNVNVLNLTDVTNSDKVLIDTWWNVNSVIGCSCGCSGSVLIDTWWNVNTTSFIMSINSHFRFNRYMVECEYKCPAGVWTIGYGFNRYMVECESSEFLDYPHGYP